MCVCVCVCVCVRVCVCVCVCVYMCVWGVAGSCDGKFVLAHMRTYVPLRLDASANEGRRTEVVYVDW